MRQKTGFAVLALSLLSLLACSSRGFDRGALQQHLAGDEKVISRQDIEEALAMKPQLSFPFRLGVFFDSYNKYPRSRYGSGASRIFSGDDRDIILSAFESLKEEGIVSDMFVISDAFVAGRTAEAVRLAGAKQGADAVVHIKGVYDADSYQNAAAFLYLTIAAMWFVPGTKTDVMFMTSGVMYDVGNGYIYLAAEADEKGSKTGALHSKAREAAALINARAGSLQSFREEFVKRLRSLRGPQEQ